MNKFFLPAFIFLILFSVSTVFAQQQQDQAGTLLPDINPQDIEIRGDFQARFPGLSRQPILGFNPRPRVFQIDPNRMPFIESIDDVVATVSISDLEEPLTPETDPIFIPQQHHTFARIGFGRFISPEASIQHESSVGENKFLVGDLNFHQTQGHLDDWDSAFLRSNLDLSYRTYQADRSFQADLGFMYDQTDMPDNRPRPEFYYFDLTHAASINTGFTYAMKSTAYDGFTTSVNFRHFISGMDYNCDFYSRCGLMYFTPPRNRVSHANASVHRYLSGRRIEEIWHIESDWDLDRIKPTFNSEYKTRLSTKSGIGYERRLHYNLKGKFNVDLVYTLFDSDHEFRVRPGLWLEYVGLDNTKITFQARAYSQHNNPYTNYLIHQIGLDNSVHRPETGYDTHLDIDYSLFEGLTLYAENKLRFLNSGSSFGFRDGQYQHNMYLIMSIDNGWQLQNRIGAAYEFIPYNITMSGDVTISNGESFINETDNSSDFTFNGIPNQSPFQINFSLFTNPLPNFYITSWLDIYSERKFIVNELHSNAQVSLSTESLDKYALLNLQMDYRVSSNFGLYLKGLNLLNQEYEIWKGYQERPLQIYGGITIRL